MFLVTGVTGRHGGTGAFVATSLLKQGHRVRALVRKVDPGVEALRGQGAEIVVADLVDRRTLGPALEGIETAYFTWPVAAGIVNAAAHFASAGRKAGLKRVVVMSMGAAHPESPSALGRAQWLAEELLEWAGFSCLHLRVAAYFFENLQLLHQAEIEGDGVLRSSYGDVPTNWMAGVDAARLAVAALLDPAAFGSQGTAVYPTGNQRHTMADLARILGAHLGRSLRHETISTEAWQQNLVGLARSGTRVNEDMAAHISALGAGRREMPVNDLFQKAVGRAPMSLADTLRENQDIRTSSSRTDVK